MLSPRKISLPALVSLLLGCVSVVSAHGRKPGYQEQTVYAPPVRRGSAANPNAAFSPPNFNNDPFTRPVPVATGAAATPPVYNYGYDKAAASRAAAAATPRKEKPAPAAAAVNEPSTPNTAQTGQTQPIATPSPSTNLPTATPTPAAAPAPTSTTPSIEATQLNNPPSHTTAPPPPPSPKSVEEGVPGLPGFDAPTTVPANTDGLQAPDVHPTPTQPAATPGQ